MITQPDNTILTQPKVSFLVGDYAILVADYRIEIPSLKAILDIRQGFWYDGASKPPILWNIPFCGTPWDADSLPAATVHDFLCKTRFVPRKLADEIFHELLIGNGVNRIKAYTFYRAVRVGAALGAGNPSEEEVAWARRLGGIQSKDESIDSELAIMAWTGRPKLDE